jgi:hypothetical protein
MTIIRLLRRSTLLGCLLLCQTTLAQGTGTPSTTNSNTRNSDRSKAVNEANNKGAKADTTTTSTTTTGPNRADCSPADKGKPSQNPNCAGEHNIDPSSVKNPNTPVSGSSN